MMRIARSRRGCWGSAQLFSGAFSLLPTRLKRTLNDMARRSTASAIAWLATSIDNTPTTRIAPREPTGMGPRLQVLRLISSLYELLPNTGSIFADVLHFGPILLEVELRAIIQVVALHAHLHDLPLIVNLPCFVAFVVDNFEPQCIPQRLLFYIRNCDFAILRSG